MKCISIVLDYNLVQLKSDLLRELAVYLDNEMCARGLNCSFTRDFIEGTLRISVSLISNEEFTYSFFIDIVSLVKEIFDKLNIYLKVKSVSSF